MINVYYRGVVFIFFVFYGLLYFRAGKRDLKTIYIGKYLSLLLGKSNGEQNIPIIILVGHIVNLLNLLVGIFSYLIIPNKTALEIYKYSILLSLLVVFLIDMFLDKKA
jgi:hypothetical protein